MIDNMVFHTVFSIISFQLVLVQLNKGLCGKGLTLYQIIVYKV